jgi:predicted RecB family endonuclease
MGWNKYQKADKMKAAQLVAYKSYFSRQYGVPVDNIEVEFFIVKAKVGRRVNVSTKACTTSTTSIRKCYTQTNTKENRSVRRRVF